MIAPVDTPVNPDMPTPEQKAEGTRRLNEANKIRKEKKENWANPELTAFLAGEDEKELRQEMVDVLSEKDHTDCVCSCLLYTSPPKEWKSSRRKRNVSGK